jgi:hypothetical protein
MDSRTLLLMGDLAHRLPKIFPCYYLRNEGSGFCPMPFERGKPSNPQGTWRGGESGNPAGSSPGLADIRLNRKPNRKMKVYIDVETGEKKYSYPRGQHDRPTGSGSQGGPGSRGGKTLWEPTVVDGEAPPVDPLDYLSDVVSGRARPDRDKTTAAAILAPFMHVKPTGEFLSKRLDMPAPKNVNEALQQIQQINAMVQTQYITIQEGERLVAMLNTFIEATRGSVDHARIEQLERILIERGAPVVAISIDGGLPALPLEEGQPGIIMPDLSGGAPDAPDARPPDDPKSESET